MQQIEQSTVTKKFIDSVNHLIDTGIIKNAKELAERLDWNASTMSEVLNKKRNVPQHIAMRLQAFASGELRKQRDVALGMDGAVYEKFLGETDDKLGKIEAQIRNVISYLVELEYLMRQDNADTEARDKGIEIIRTALAQLYGVIKDRTELNRLINVVMSELKDKRIELHQRIDNIHTSKGAIGYYNRDTGLRFVYDNDLLGFQGNLSCWCGSAMLSATKGNELLYYCPTHDVQISALWIRKRFYELLANLSLPQDKIAATKRKLLDLMVLYKNGLPKGTNSIVTDEKIDDLLNRLADLPGEYRKLDTFQIDKFFDFAFHGQLRFNKGGAFEGGYISDILHVDEDELRQKKLFIFNRDILEAIRDPAVEINLLFNVFYIYEIATKSVTDE
jgi:hypothetical protein